MAIVREKKITIGSRNFIIKFPNVGQLIDLESLKLALTNNRYGNMAASGIASMYDALDMVDAIAFYTIVVPEVAKYYNIENFSTTQIDNVSELIKVYLQDIKPWFNDTMKELKNVSKDSNVE